MINLNIKFHPNQIKHHQQIILAIAMLILFMLLNVGCYAEQASVNYAKNGLVFDAPATWVIKEDYRAPGSRRSVSVESPDTSLVLIEMYAKDVLLEIPEYKQYASSLKQFSIRYNSRDITGKLQSKQPISYANVNRKGFDGLKETQQFQIGGIVNDTLIREYYRIDTDIEIVFIVLDTSKDEYNVAGSGIDFILSSFKYKPARIEATGAISE